VAGCAHDVDRYLRDALQERSASGPGRPSRKRGREHAGGQGTINYRPDVQVREPWTLKEPAAAAVAAPSPSPTATDPIRVFLEEEVERWLEIRDTGGRLITVLEVLSPSNKLESAERDQYRRKRQSFISAGVNLVEIDLVRQGTTVFPEAIRRVLREAGAGYGVCVFRAAQPVAYEVYPVRLRDRLPVIRVPLRPTDADVVLDLQRSRASWTARNRAKPRPPRNCSRSFTRNCGDSPRRRWRNNRQARRCRRRRWCMRPF
jgi:hypothetical protein